MGNEVRITITGDASKLKAATEAGGGHLDRFASKTDDVSRRLRSANDSTSDGWRKLGDDIDVHTTRSEGRLGAFKDRVTGFAGGFASNLTAVAGPIATVFAVDKLVDWGGQLFDLGQKLDVFAKKTATVFEGSANQVRSWADANNEAFGLSDEELAGLAAGFGDLVKPMGFTAEQAAAMSTNVVGLSGALSAWSGGTRSAAEVSEILAKAMLGERDSLKELGISISQAEVDARVAATTTGDLTEAQLAQARALATQQLIFEKSTDAQKAWADGSMDSIKNTNTLKAAFEDLKAGLAEKLLPIAARVTQWLASEAVPWIGRLIDRGQALWTEWAPKIGAALSAMWDQAKTVFSALSDAWDTVVSWFSSGSDSIAGKSSWLGETIGKLGGMFESAWGAIQAIVSTVVDAVTALWEQFGDIILKRAQGYIDGLKNIFSGLVDALTGIFDLIKAVLTGKWGAAWDAVKKIASGAWKVVQGLLQEAWSIIAGIFEAIGRTIGALWSKAWQAVKDMASAAWSWVVDKIRSAFEWAQGIAMGAVTWFAGLPGRIKAALAGLWDSISAGFSLAWGWVRGKADDLVGYFRGLPGRIASAVSGMWDGIKNAFRSAINWVIDKWNGLSFTLPKITIPLIGTVGGGTFGTPNIPRLAQGGVTTGPTLALIGDNPSGREAVVPLERAGALGFGAPANININVTVDPAVPQPVETGRAVSAALEEWVRANGVPPWLQRALAAAAA